MPFHFCHEELAMLMVTIPFIGLIIARCRAWWSVKCECPYHKHHD